MYNSKLQTLLQQKPEIAHIFKILRHHHLPQATLCAGTIRSLVWNAQTNRHVPLMLSELDVYYRDPSESYEDFQVTQATFKQAESQYLWNLQNIALPPRHGSELHFHSTMEETLADFPETCTSVGVQCLADGTYEIIAPHGLDDLFELKIRPTANYLPGSPLHTRFEQRVKNKRWLTEWPDLQIIEE
ncbi:hypothetical protein LPAF129_06680 [Ligilactobacillus pabuli]|uniref:Nucleotidyltransferase family protein n=1 Tax=Ligilactobacillus pabuli TaxID=2886039 RepID=A0ABQ5JGK7_9LACO|nr:nucleotidyltransferase family protein [Ligilactobacillus pabuli]GKS80983.1 hypothetical protein LPAF129_06680 [Ligilactobacillus pabuli]